MLGFLRLYEGVNLYATYFSEAVSRLRLAHAREVASTLSQPSHPNLTDLPPTVIPELQLWYRRLRAGVERLEKTPEFTLNLRFRSSLDRLEEDLEALDFLAPEATMENLELEHLTQLLSKVSAGTTRIPDFASRRIFGESLEDLLTVANRIHEKNLTERKYEKDYGERIVRLLDDLSIRVLIDQTSRP